MQKLEYHVISKNVTVTETRNEKNLIEAIDIAMPLHIFFTVVILLLAFGHLI